MSHFADILSPWLQRLEVYTDNIEHMKAAINRASLTTAFVRRYCLEADSFDLPKEFEIVYYSSNGQS